jgi:hypothetical protein
VRSPRSLWEAFRLGRDMSTRPSTIYEVEDPLVAWCFDRSVEVFGRSMEDAIRKSAEGAKNEKAGNMAAQRTAQKWLASADPEHVRIRGRFRDPLGG